MRRYMIEVSRENRQKGQKAMNELDMTPRYAPEVVTTIRGRFPVSSYCVYPPNGAPENSPIRRDMTTVEFQTAGGSRWYGCERAYINSELRLVVVGTDTRDEVRMKWQVCKVKP